VLSKTGKWLQTLYDFDDSDADNMAVLLVCEDVAAIAEFLPEDFSFSDQMSHAKYLMRRYKDWLLGKVEQPKPKPKSEPKPVATEKKRMPIDSTKRYIDKDLPRRPLSIGMVDSQIKVLKQLIDSVEVDSDTGQVVFDEYDLDSGGIPLNEARPTFLSLLARSGICEVRDAAVETKTGQKRWGKKVLPVMPFAREVVQDYIERNKGKT